MNIYGLLRTLANVLFIVAWVLLAFFVLRAVLTTWLRDRRLAVVVAFAIAASYALGAGSPYVFRGFGYVATQQAASEPAAIAQSASSSAASRCAVGSHATVGARGHIDTIAVGDGAPEPAAGTARVPAGTAVTITGWVMPASGSAAVACALVDGRAVDARVSYGVQRDDVSAALHDPKAGTSGFSVLLTLGPGSHRVAVGVVKANGTLEAVASTVAVDVR